MLCKIIYSGHLTIFFLELDEQMLLIQTIYGLEVIWRSHNHLKKLCESIYNV